jgi:eukaryotic-like serine/threonine-protein kinase
MTQSCPACGTPIDSSGDEPLTRVICSTCGQKMLLQRSFDHFVVVETLGVGGMGTVYKARDTHLDRDVALKLLRKDIGGEQEQSARLQAEARIAASVNHPNVVQIFSLGTDHGRFYVVMELIDHGSLDDLIESQGRLPEEQVLEVGIQIARGLRAAHRKGLIHRDVKPANILFVDEQAAKIGDFGLAAFATQDPQGSQSDHVIWGTPAYVAPERLCNQLEDVRSDIYSFGATLFHAVAGKPPIETSTSSATELRELKQHPSSLRAIAPEVSASTARVLQQMIKPDPTERFSSYDDVLAQLDAARRAFEFANDREAARRSSRWSLNRLFRNG